MTALGAWSCVGATVVYMCQIEALLVIPAAGSKSDGGLWLTTRSAGGCQNHVDKLSCTKGICAHFLSYECCHTLDVPGLWTARWATQLLSGGQVVLLNMKATACPCLLAVGPAVLVTQSCSEAGSAVICDGACDWTHAAEYVQLAHHWQSGPCTKRRLLGRLLVIYAAAPLLCCRQTWLIKV